MVLQLCELFHCRPSELNNEDGLLLLRLMELKGWRDRALEYDNDPSSKSVSNEDKMRFTFLVHGDDDALHAEPEKLTMERLREVELKGEYKLGKSKQREIVAEARRATQEFRNEELQAQKK